MSIAPIAYRFNHGRCVDFFLSALFDPFYFFLAPNRVRQPLVAPRGSSSVAVIALKIFDCCVGCIGSIPIDLSTCQYHHGAIHRMQLFCSRASLCATCVLRFFSHPRSSRELFFFRELPAIVPWPFVANKMVDSLFKILAVVAVSIGLLRRLLVRSYRCLNSAIPHVGRSKATINL